MARKREAERVIDTLKGTVGETQLIASTALPTRPGVVAPPPPSGLAVLSNVTIRSGGAPKAIVTLAWVPALGATVSQYLIEIARDSGFTTGVTRYAASGSSAALTLDAGVTFWARIRSESTSGPSAWTAAISFTAANDTTVPAALTGIGWTWGASGDLLITWDLPTDTATRIVRVSIYADATKATLYRVLEGASSVLWTASMNRTDTGGTPDAAVYVELTPVSWSNVVGSAQTPSPQPSLAAPATPTGLNTSWASDTGTAGPDLVVVWNTATDASYYKLTLDSVTVTVIGQRYVLTLDQNRAQHSGTPDPVISISLVAYNGLDRASTAATGTATNAAPAAPATVSIIAVPGAIVATVEATEPADFLTYRYRFIQTNPSAADVVVDSRAKVLQQPLSTAATYQVGVKVVDAFGQASSETLSSATSLDLTISTLRAEIVYSDSSSTAAATLKAALADDNMASGGISYTPAGAWVWVRAERALLDRYRFVTVSIAQVSGFVSWYLRTSIDGATWRYFAAPVTGRVLTEVANQTAAQFAGIGIATLGSASANRAELPVTVEARYIELWMFDAFGTARVDEFYPRRLVEADNIRAEELAAISADLGSITAGSITGVTITGGTVQTATSGARVMMDASGIRTYDSAGVVQIEATTGTDGALTAAAGAIVLDDSGMTVTGSQTIKLEKVGQSSPRGHVMFDDLDNLNTTRLEQFTSSSSYSRLDLAPGLALLDVNYPAGLVAGSLSIANNAITLTASSGVKVSSGLNVGSATGAGSGEVRASAGFLPPRSGGSAVFGIDATNQGSAITIANNGTATPFGAGSNFAGLVIINETAVDGSLALFLTGGGTVTLVASTAVHWSNTAGTGLSTNFYRSGTNLTLENRRGGSRTYNVFAIRTRTSN